MRLWSAALVLMRCARASGGSLLAKGVCSPPFFLLVVISRIADSRDCVKPRQWRKAREGFFHATPAASLRYLRHSVICVTHTIRVAPRFTSLKLFAPLTVTPCVLRHSTSCVTHTIRVTDTMCSASSLFSPFSPPGLEGF